MSNKAAPKPQLCTPGDAAAALQAAQELKKMLMGPAKGNMNLAGVSARAAALRKSVDQIIGGLQYNAHNVHWSVWLKL